MNNAVYVEAEEEKKSDKIQCIVQYINTEGVFSSGNAYAKYLFITTSVTLFRRRLEKCDDD